jgi:hypothetical protein
MTVHVYGPWKLQIDFDAVGAAIGGQQAAFAFFSTGRRKLNIKDLTPAVRAAGDCREAAGEGPVERS